MGQRRVVLVLHDLEVPDPQEEGEEPRAGQAGADDDPQPIAAPLARGIPAERVETHREVRRAVLARPVTRPGIGGESAEE